MANPLYGQRGLSSIYNSSSTPPPASRSAIDAPSNLLSSSSTRYLSSYTQPHTLSSTPSSSSAFPDLYRFSVEIPNRGTTSAKSAAPVASATSYWPHLDLSSSLAKRSSQALYDKSIMDAHMYGQSEAWLASDSSAKRPRLESATYLPIYPQRPGEKDCAHYMLTRTCKFGETCKFDHPVWVPMGGIPDWKEVPPVTLDHHPERPGEPDCPYFVKTQNCKFGPNCRFNHPKDMAISGGASDLPERPSEPPCSFYTKTGICKYGATCKFHHPKDVHISAGDQAGNIEQVDSVANVSTSSDMNVAKTLTSASAISYNTKGLPMRVGETDCPFYMKTGSCKYGASCRYNHPDRSEFCSPFSIMNSPAAVVGHSLTPPVAPLNVGLVNPMASIFPTLTQTSLGLVHPAVYPQRPGQAECDYYMKNGECKFGERCKFHHPLDRSAPKVTPAGLPRREGMTHCPYYMKTGACSYGVTCKFDHPPPGEVLALAGKETASDGDKKNGDNVNGEKEEKKGES